MISDDLGSDKFRDLFLNDVPLMDVRAPVEFNAGAFPTAVNLPILDDQQRHAIGREYIQNGQMSAIELGNSLATPEVRQRRLQHWQSFTEQNPDGYLYCFRGGLRSRITQQWLRDSGVDYPLIKGGYKSLRRFLLNELQRLCTAGNIILLSGTTGVGKTELIQGHCNSIDLESRANHRGSAFGKTFIDQPAQIDWENQIIIDWLKCEARSNAPVVIEAESRMIGRVCLSEPLQAAMSAAPVVVLTASLADRIARLLNDYVLHHLNHFKKVEQDPWLALQENVLENLTRIKRRLGDQRYNDLCRILPRAVSRLRDYSDPGGFGEIVEVLLIDYYDKLYNYNLDKNRDSIVFSGDADAVKQWLKRKNDD